MCGYVRPTKDLDVWVAADSVNTDKLRIALQKFGFSARSLPTPLFEPPRTLLRMGVPPNMLEVLSEIAGVSFSDCYPNRRMLVLDGLEVAVIDLTDLKKNKSATGRARDLDDVQKLQKP